MTEDTAVTDRLRQLAEDAKDDLGGHTIVIDEEVEPDENPDDEMQHSQPE